MRAVDAQTDTAIASTGSQREKMRMPHRPRVRMSSPKPLRSKPPKLHLRVLVCAEPRQQESKQRTYCSNHVVWISCKEAEPILNLAKGPSLARKGKVQDEHVPEVDKKCQASDGKKAKRYYKLATKAFADFKKMLEIEADNRRQCDYGPHTSARQDRSAWKGESILRRPRNQRARSSNSAWMQVAGTNTLDWRGECRCAKCSQPSCSSEHGHRS